MFHLVDNFQNTAGDALVGYYVKLKDQDGNYASLYSDANGTPIIGVSGLANAGITDSDGMFDLYVEDGIYDLEFFDKNDSSLLVARRVAVPLLGSVFTQAGDDAVSRTVQDKLRDVVSVKDFGATGDGATDDTAAVQAAVDAVAVGGGAVVFPAGGRYLITDTITVSSVFPVSLLGEQFGVSTDASDDMPCLLVGAAMASMFRYEAPNQSTRAYHGSGKISGLQFRDPTSPDDAAAGTRTISTALLDLWDFSFGLIENCVFQWIKGSVIKTDFAVMTSVKSCRIRYSGDLSNPTRSVILLGATDAGFTTQSFLIDETRVEVCYSTYYVSATSAYSNDITLRAMKFEAATVEYPDSSNTFINIAIDRYVVDGCSFNRNDAVQVLMGGRGKLVNCHFTNAAGARNAVTLSGARCIVANNIFEDNCTAVCIEASGVDNLITGNVFYLSGAFYATGRGNAFIGNQVISPAATSSTYAVILGGKCLAANNRFDDDGTPGVGGIIANDTDRVLNNFFDRWATASLPCVRRVHADAVIHGNSYNSVTLAYSESTGAAAGAGFRYDGAQVVGPQQAFIADPSGGATVDTEGRAATAAILDLLVAHDLMAPS